MGRKTFLALCAAICIVVLFSGCSNNINRAASRQGYIDVKYFIEHGTSPNERNRGWTPLTWSAYYGNHRIAEYLLENGANVNLPKIRTKKQPKYDGYTPLHFAAFFGHINVVKVLLDHGALTNLKDSWDNTALDYANEYGFDNIAEMIDKAGKE